MQRPVGRLERFISILLVLVLIFIIASVLVKQGRYDRSYFEAARVTEKGSSGQIAAEAAYLEKITPQGFKTSAKSEVYGPDDLYVKIDGKAELYLESGFKKLDCQHYANSSDPNAWIEFYAYDMGTALNAFSVYTVQKRPGATDINVGDMAYTTGDAVFACVGKFYCEIMSSGVSQQIQKAMIETGAKFASQSGEAGGKVEQLEIFPKENLVAGSYKLYLKDVYGFEDIPMTFSAVYKVGGWDVTAFVYKAADEAKAKELAEKYKQFVIENSLGKAAIAKNIELQDAIIDLDGAFEIVFAKGLFVAGVHECESQQAAEAVAIGLYKKIKS